MIYGDVNGDGAVTSMDLLYVKRHILGTKLLEEPVSDGGRCKPVEMTALHQ